jgi:hypothetical protein
VIVPSSYGKKTPGFILRSDTVTRAELSTAVLVDVLLDVLLVVELELPVVVELLESAAAQAVARMSSIRMKLKIPTRLFMKSSLFFEKMAIYPVLVV